MSDSVQSLTAAPVRRVQPTRRESITIDFRYGELPYTVSFSRFENGDLAEMFLRGGKTGSSAEVAAHDGAIILSIALQYGVPLQAIQHALLKLHDGRAAGPIGRALELAVQQ